MNQLKNWLSQPDTEGVRGSDVVAFHTMILICGGVAFAVFKSPAQVTFNRVSQRNICDGYGSVEADYKHDVCLYRTSNGGNRVVIPCKAAKMCELESREPKE
jgi:hypothetical protein